MLDFSFVSNVWLGCTDDAEDCLKKILYLVGDVNRDLYVNQNDLFIMAENWLSQTELLELISYKMSDFAILAKYWLNNDCINFQGCEGMDLDGSGFIDISDLNLMLESWLSHIP